MSINCYNGLQTLQLSTNGNKKCASICRQRARTRGYPKQSSHFDNANKNVVYGIGEIVKKIYFYITIKYIY
ncbi:MAG: hypothetical protein RLZZ196_3127 [Bacteroidota bacterium]|jgi:hypothetical protein